MIYLLLLVQLLLPVAALAAPTPTPVKYLGDRQEGSDHKVKAVVVDPVTGAPVLVDEATHWLQTKPSPPNLPTMIYEGAVQLPNASTVYFDLPPESSEIVDNDLDIERGVVVLRFKINERYLTMFPELGTVNRYGFEVVNGVLVPEATPTPGQ